VWPDEPDAILAAHAQRLQGFDAQLAALDAQLRRDQDLRRQVRRQRHALQAFPPADVLFARRAFQFQMPDLQAAMGPQAGPPRPLAPSQGGPEMLPRAAADNNVHGLGRDAAARRAMATLLHRYEALDVNDTLDDLRQFMMRHFERRGRLAVDLHESGCSVLSAAAKVLGSDVPIARMMPLALLHPSNTLAISEQGFDVVSMARICAVIWHTIGILECPPTDPMGTEALRTERKEAFIRAMSRCLLSPTLLVCAPGQSQRLLMVLQGFVPGMQVEIFDAPAPVAQFVTAQALKLRAQLGEEGPFAAQTVRQSLDAVCLEGHALYQGKERLDMEKQLQDLAFWSYDLEGWAPPGV